ncbi:hypothetical protein [Zunongwangia endophytica]|uniref:DUF4870 domain-containing protein n=1 Tax=Zunongwangia endophytica TaxID=1808945 RepID=A0ABV8H1U9_9FLAO|nr:hypothetical protein [Zunongwangia endophytica]MDN3594291.1 hypothetical protein [Zunongwangia endophytica]
MNQNTQNTPTNGKTAAITAYITIFGLVLAIFFNMENKHKFASFHIRQALGTHILFYVLGAIASIFTNFFIPTAFYLVYVVLAIYGLIAAIQGEFRLIPYIGEYFQKWFKSIT